MILRGLSIGLGLVPLKCGLSALLQQPLRCQVFWHVDALKLKGQERQKLALM